MQDAAAAQIEAINDSRSIARETDGPSALGEGVSIGRRKCDVGLKPSLEDESAVTHRDDRDYSQLLAVVGPGVFGQPLFAGSCRRHGAVNYRVPVARGNLQADGLRKRENITCTGGSCEIVFPKGRQLVHRSGAHDKPAFADRETQHPIG